MSKMYEVSRLVRRSFRLTRLARTEGFSKLFLTPIALTDLLLINCLFELSPMFVDEYLVLVYIREVKFVVRNCRSIY